LYLLSLDVSMFRYHCVTTASCNVRAAEDWCFACSSIGSTTHYDLWWRPVRTRAGAATHAVSWAKLLGVCLVPCKGVWECCTSWVGLLQWRSAERHGAGPIPLSPNCIPRV